MLFQRSPIDAHMKYVNVCRTLIILFGYHIVKKSRNYLLIELRKLAKLSQVNVSNRRVV